jgi:hypothetical protein
MDEKKLIKKLEFLRDGALEIVENPEKFGHGDRFYQGRADGLDQALEFVLRFTKGETS